MEAVIRARTPARPSKNDGSAMKTREPTTRRLRALIDRPGAIRAMGLHDVLSAVILENAGLECLFVGGFATSASLHGLPDLSFLGLAEMEDAVRRVTRRVTVPVIADADTGHGDIHHVVRSAAALEASGAAGLILEDQVFPKRCGHFEGKQIVSPEEMVLRIKAALLARSDPEFVLVARTDAREPNGIDDAIDRVNRYCDAGADVAFVEAPLSVSELEAVATRVRAPKLVNMLPFGKTPILPASDLESMGYKFIVASIDTVLVIAGALQRLAQAFLREGRTDSLQPEMLSFAQLKATLGVEDFLSLRENLSKSLSKEP